LSHLSRSAWQYLYRCRILSSLGKLQSQSKQLTWIIFFTVIKCRKSAWFLLYVYGLNYFETIKNYGKADIRWIVYRSWIADTSHWPF
jgi:hypothetical protein